MLPKDQEIGLHEKATGRRNVDGMRSIRRSQLQQNILHMRLHSCLRNGKVRSDYLVGRAARYFSKYFDFALAEIIFCICARRKIQAAFRTCWTDFRNFKRSALI